MWIEIMKINPTSELMRAAEFAAQRHAAQNRKGAVQEPYVNHLIEVASLLAAATDGRDTALLMAGLLHDTVEDVGVTAKELTEAFGADVAQLVLEVTDDKTLEKAERKRLQVEKAPHKSQRAKMIKMADKISNVRAITSSPPPDWDMARKRAYFHWAKQVVDGCRDANTDLALLFDETYTEGLAKLKEQN